MIFKRESASIDSVCGPAYLSPPVAADCGGRGPKQVYRNFQMPGLCN